MSREDPQMKVRMPANLKDQIEQAAKTAGRSMNAEIVARLQRSLEGDGLGLGGDLIDVVSLLAFVGAMLGRTVDRDKFSNEDRDMLDRLRQISERVIQRTSFSKTGPNVVDVTTPPPVEPR